MKWKPGWNRAHELNCEHSLKGSLCGLGSLASDYATFRGKGWSSRRSGRIWWPRAAGRPAPRPHPAGSSDTSGLGAQSALGPFPCVFHPWNNPSADALSITAITLSKEQNFMKRFLLIGFAACTLALAPILSASAMPIAHTNTLAGNDSPIIQVHGWGHHHGWGHRHWGHRHWRHRHWRHHYGHHRW